MRVTLRNTLRVRVTWVNTGQTEGSRGPSVSDEPHYLPL